MSIIVTISRIIVRKNSCSEYQRSVRWKTSLISNICWFFLSIFNPRDSSTPPPPNGSQMDQGKCRNRIMWIWIRIWIPAGFRSLSRLYGYLKSIEHRRSKKTIKYVKAFLYIKSNPKGCPNVHISSCACKLARRLLILILILTMVITSRLGPRRSSTMQLYFPHFP